MIILIQDLDFIEHIKELHVEVKRDLVLSIQENLDIVIPYYVSELSDVSRGHVV